MKKKQSLDEYLLNLEARGFKFSDDIIHFIYFGKKSTNASDALMIVAVEITLKVQKEFDSSFFLSLVEQLAEQKIEDRQRALEFAEAHGLIL
ncbi:DUF6123 family protein [Bacillus thermotolerans]|uniref:Uncharacterized protein n=1 Tax=Bacillus thermotolerans TaxID=1221996 RepID=A0A0F5HWN8_BACTR|nr:DUF6123 family protein [Bacillus thermotolerans]KKB37696.1 hypothetical protein QY95_02806 [Bacillus thermotolerans]KKB38510.1 hypothetical protein QY97_02419 [Bacillus thermotolerans]KKB39926.1 hypothetical protein QY96_02659 [Bacillus thermotolerans]